jgi:hypothetical protein
VAVDGRDALDRVVAMPITRWRYKQDAQGVTHLGPTAQDFFTAFGLGASDRSIPTIDADGVALAAIQGLKQALDAKDAQIRALQSRLDGMEAIQGRVAALEAMLLAR